MEMNLIFSTSAELHYGPVWSNRDHQPFHSYAACNPSGQLTTALTTYKPWVTCEACKATEAFQQPDK